LPAGTLSAVVVAPDGTRLALDDVDVPVPLTGAGLYRLEADLVGGRGAVRRVALALTDARESALSPRPVVVGGQRVAEEGEPTPGWRELARWPLALALVLVVVEGLLWWRPRLARRRGTSARARLSRFRRRLATVRFPAILRSLILLCLILALLGVRWSLPSRDLASVFLVDRSASVGGAFDEAVAFVEGAMETKAPGDRAAVVVFGGDAWVDRELSTAPELAPVATRPRAGATDIEGAVRLGLALLPEGAPGRLILLTDGVETAGRAEGALAEARARGVDLVVVPVGTGLRGPEVWVEGLDLPTPVYPDDPVSLAVTVGSDAPRSVELYWRAGEERGRRIVEVEGAGEPILVPVAAGEQGLVPVRACIRAEADTYAQNNCAGAWLAVQGPPRILVVGEPGERSAIVAALRGANLLVDEAEADGVPLNPQGWAGYAGVVVVNTPARAFPLSSLAALRSFVKDLGGGLLAIGGPSSYGVGGWLGTPLEETLPVEMRVQDPRRFPPLAMAVVIDKSGSMSAPEAGSGGRSKMQLAAEAAVRVAETLNDADILAVVAFDDRPADTLGPISMAEREELIAQVLRLQAGGGGIYVRESLAYASQLLAEVELVPGQQRHILLLADGSDAEHQEGALALAQEVRKDGVTLSVVAIGSGQDVSFLHDLAQVGEGRFYLTESAADLPAIFAEETARAQRSYVVEELFHPKPLSAWAPVADLRATPPLRGYVAATPKPAAQVVWEAEHGDPLLAAWQFGLGRAVAWTSDATGRWGSEWLAWEEFAAFWGGVVRWTLPPPSDADFSLDVAVEGEEARVVVDVTGPEREYVDGLELALQVGHVSAGVPQELTLEQTAPGRYEGRFAAPESGAYLLRLHGDRNLTTGWSRPYPEEYRPGGGEAPVERLAALADAEVVGDPSVAFAHDLVGRERGAQLAPGLVLLAALAWPLDVAWRRLALSRRDLARFVNRLRSRVERRPGPDPAPVDEPTLARRLRARQGPDSESGPPRNEVEPPVAGPPPPSPAAAPPADAPSEETLASRLKRRIKQEGSEE
jgi:uncharacterized membrane protein